MYRHNNVGNQVMMDFSYPKYKIDVSNQRSSVYDRVIPYLPPPVTGQKQYGSFVFKETIFNVLSQHRVSIGIALCPLEKIMPVDADALSIEVAGSISTIGGHQSYPSFFCGLFDDRITSGWSQSDDENLMTGFHELPVNDASYYANGSVFHISKTILNMATYFDKIDRTKFFGFGFSFFNHTDEEFVEIFSGWLSARYATNIVKSYDTF